MHKINIAKHLFLSVSLFILTGVTLLSSAQVRAEYFGFPTGRSAKISTLPDKSVEAGFHTGDIGDFSYQHFGSRFNLRTSDEVMVYFDVVQADVEDVDGLAFGAGFFYQISGLTKKNDFAVKVSYHTIKLEESGSRNELKGDIVSIEGLLSGEKIGESDLRWYTNFGIHKPDFEDADNDTELGFGGGVFKDTSFGEFYAGIDLIDELTFGLGVRYHLK